MRKVYKDRLLKIADFLENILPKKHFDLEYFTRDKDIDTDDDDDSFSIRSSDENEILIRKLNKIKKDFKPHTCGAVACAIGWMPAIFPRTFKWDKDASVILRTGKSDYADADFDVVQTFLGINYDKTIQLFTFDYYPKGRHGPKSVAKKIKQFVKTGKLSDKTYNVEECFVFEEN